MRKQHLSHISRVGLPALLPQNARHPLGADRLEPAGRWAWAAALFGLVLASCAPQTPDDPKAAQPSAAAQKAAGEKDAAGVDAEFGVQTFALSEPTLTVVAPTALQQYKVAAAGVKATVEFSFTVSNFTLGQVRCYLDGTFVGAAPTSPYKFVDVPKGLHTVACVLADDKGSELANAAARGVRQIKVVEPCLANSDCNDGMACSQDACVDKQCVYGAIPTCCGSKYDCQAGEFCLNPNTDTAQCSTCQKDADCDDQEVCTTDKCDLSGLKGVCQNNKSDVDCCSKAADPCDDGKACTVDQCDVATGKCKHVQPAGTCCSDTECASNDPCTVGQCVDSECRYGPDVFKKDCCSTTFNPKCDDKNFCTIDKCDKPQGSWTQCSHVVPQDQIGVCCEKLGTTLECDDGQPCTYDICTNYICEHQKVGDCCTATLECDDSNPCTLDKCAKPTPDAKTGECQHEKIPGCCTDNPDCNDNKWCTYDACNITAMKCVYTKLDPKCCDTEDECSDGKFCTDKACINHTCVFGPDIFKPNCCDSNANCNDNKPCTIDTCDTATHQCQYTSNGVEGCCNGSLDCDDGECNTVDFCDGFNQCKSAPMPDACQQDVDCDDAKPCTLDACKVVDGCKKCVHEQLPESQCCESDVQCDDSKFNPPNAKAACTTDKCVGNKCQNSVTANCCLDDADAKTSCDDNNACTIEYCVNNECRHTVPKGGCCAFDTDCNDGDPCTTDKCGNLVGGKGTCTATKIAGCPTPPCVPNDATTYNDNNACTQDSCTASGTSFLESHIAIPGCCLDKFDCDDGKACTYDYCLLGECVHTSEEGGVALCCSAETEAVDCANLNSDCAVGKCLDQPDGSKQCQAVEKVPCTVNLGYCQDFAASKDLKAMGWVPGDVKGTAATNWGVDTSGGLGPDQFARLTWTPTKTNYYTCLQSPIIQAAGSQAVTIQYDREFLPNGGKTNIAILGSLDGANVNWNTATFIDLIAAEQTLGPETLTVNLPAELVGSNGLRLAFCVSGDSTFNLQHYAIDNVCVVKGGPPVIKKCPANQTVPMGSKVSIPLKVTDPDASDVISFSLVAAPSFVKLSSSTYYWLDQTWNATLTINPLSLNDVGEHEVTVKYTDGFLYGTCTFKISVTYQGGYLIWQPSEVPSDSAQAIKASLAKAGQFGQIVPDLALYPSLTKFQGVFVTLGVYPANHVLLESEVDSLKLYLSQGGKLYMEGGDTWVFDPPTTLHNFFKVKPVLDSAPNGVTGPLKGYAAYADTSVSPTKNYLWAFNQDGNFNNANDQIEGNTAVARTRNILKSDGDEKFWVQVGHDDKLAAYRTIGSSIPFAGVQAAGTDTPDSMIAQVLKFFANGFQDCTKEADCDDGNTCTKDTCVAGECKNDNECLCGAQKDVECGASLAKIVTNSGQFTDAVNSYPCDPGTQYLGKEVAYGLKLPQSRPVTVEISNVTNPNARLFVIKATTKGCDPAGCIGFDAAKVTFPAGKDAQYYLVVDVPGDDESAQFDLKVTCLDGEDCTNGVDDNTNNLVDCADKASCCGDAACQVEICDGADNNCDGIVDEGCDDDGDGFCDVGIKFDDSKFKPACLAGDCNDVDGTVNPGAPEICANSKDDNCNKVQDEENAKGCVNYFSDLDSDAYGTTSKCLCAPSGAFKATQGNDCNDATININPGVKETCDTPDDDNCDGSTNDINALKCTNFYTDVDGDLYGTTPFKCICKAEGLISATKPGDCADTNAAINPAIAEKCNGIDDNCDGLVDELCDDDKDGYCDTDLAYEPVAGASLDVCPKGPGDTDDSDPEINPAGKEICDGKDNDSDKIVDEDCDKDKDGYCDKAIFTVGKPPACPFGGGDCNDGTVAINPGVKEQCLTEVDDNCNDTTNDLDANDCTPYFFDADSDLFGTTASKCFCVPVGQYKAVNPGDCNDDNPKINPQVAEICDNIDNNCDKQIDEGCDDDGDAYCDSQVTMVGSPAICPNGTGDCDDVDPAVNPSKAEVCGNGKDDNCSGSQNDVGAIGCASYYADEDVDGFGTGVKKCLCEAQGTFSSTNSADCNDGDKTINPAAPELCNGLDDNCSGKVDEGCDDDGDGQCDAGMKVVGTPPVCVNGTGDCNDNKASVFKGKAPEDCDGIDDDCDGKVDNGCDDDKDGYCDASFATSAPLPAVCPKGNGDCDDLNNDVHPGAKEICGNAYDDNCNNSKNDENALGCLTFYFDSDGDKYGLNIGKCLCTGEGAFTAQKANDCADDNDKISPAAPEVCDGADNNCDNTVDEAGATGCQDFYYDEDKDGYGLDLKKCLCGKTDFYTAPIKGDCNDTSNKQSPGLAEVCDDIDNDCDTQVDEACNKDGDKFCDKAMTTVGTPLACPLGGGDCDDTSASNSPAGKEVCDGKDNNCNGTVDEGCDDDKDGYCDANLTTVGTPAVCIKGGGDCDDGAVAVNPGVAELCGNVIDENCNGTYNDKNANSCLDYYKDADGDQFGVDSSKTCLCIPEGDLKATKGGDCNDANNLIYKGATELCDGIDNNCSGVVDEGCDKDLDGYCDAAMTTIGFPAQCPKGGGDCNDDNKLVNPGASEKCGDGIDYNCDGSLNSTGGAGCTNFYYDGDGDSWGVNVKQCMCAPANGFTATKVGDCDDTNLNINPDAAEKCNSLGDDDCDGNANDVGAVGCVNWWPDADKDGYGLGAPSCMCQAQGTYIASQQGDCNDGDNNVNPGMAELCDAKDNNCVGGVDELCDKDGDKSCDAKKETVGTPPVCPNGGGDCNDGDATINKLAAEVCDNIDNNCEGTTDEQCDADKDGWCAAGKTVVGTPVICSKGKNDCDDLNNAVYPGKAEVCDNLDNNCATGADEGCDGDNDDYCTTGMAVVGLPTICPKGGGDCADADLNVNPGSAEICDNKDNNCVSGIDETCSDNDKDGYCNGAAAVSAGCPKGGGDCDDTNIAVNPGASETCSTAYDDNCNGLLNEVNAAACTNWYADADIDGFGGGTPKCQCFQSTGFTSPTGGDCNDGNKAIHPNAVEVCDGADNDCKNGTDDGCDNDGDLFCDSGMLITSTATCTKSTKPAVGQTVKGDDCNDTSSAVGPGATEICDGLDNNCNLAADEGCDDDNDNYCESGKTISGIPATCTAGGGDCNDDTTAVKPGPATTENCSTPFDDNCDGSLDGVGALGCTKYYYDNDGDSYGTASFECRCTPSGKYNATQGGDCNDNDPLQNSAGSAEICDNADNNCNGVTDEGCDKDKDGYCDKGMTVTTVNACPNTSITGGKGDDCDDSAKNVNPTGAELCDGLDNNCNGVVDDSCDKDADGYCDAFKTTIGTPTACPKGGGDCNDTDKLMSPAATEVCNGKDDNCNILVDEAGATGCSTFYYDGDQDKYGTSSSQCLCGSGSGLYNATQTGDCDDTCPTCNPASTELCDGKNNDCDASVDEGCNGDGDAYCNINMVTVGTPAICSKGGGDCNDGNGSVYPSAFELCNNADDNCNGTVDENASDQCPLVPNATVGCSAGSCVVKKCGDMFYNINGAYSDGCECNGIDLYEPNNTCGQATPIENALYDNGKTVLVEARVVDTADEDWYSFLAVDIGDGGYGVCDNFNVRVRFVKNPGGLAFEINRGGCPNGSNTVCCGHTDFNWFTNFKGASGWEPSRQWSEYGECPCQTNNDYARGHTGWNIPPGYPGGGGPYCKDYNSGYVCFPTGYYYTRCQDNSAWFYLRVYKSGGAPSCSTYKLEVSNGLYGAPGTGNGYK